MQPSVQSPDAPSRAGPRDAESDLDGTSILGLAPHTQSLELDWIPAQLGGMLRFSESLVPERFGERGINRTDNLLIKSRRIWDLRSATECYKVLQNQKSGETSAADWPS